jgi:hypothetical protein
LGLGGAWFGGWLNSFQEEFLAIHPPTN